VQVINKQAGPFNAQDENLFNMLAAMAGACLRNAQAHYATEQFRTKLKGLIEIVRACNSNMGLNSLIFTMTQVRCRVAARGRGPATNSPPLPPSSLSLSQRAPELVDADRATIFMVNHEAKELWAMQGELNVKIPLDKPSIACEVANSGEIVNIPDAYADKRFNQAFDKKNDYKTNNILCMPMKSPDGSGKVIAVIQFINKATGVFDADDVDVTSAFLDIAARIVADSQLNITKGESGNKKYEEGTLAGVKTVPTPKGSAAASKMQGFAEEGDEDEDA